MMHKKLFQPLLAIAAMGFAFTGCNKWDDHNAITDPAVGQDLFQQVAANANLSIFTGLLTKSGYDKVIASSKTFTVFAPNNTALAALDPALVNDSARLSNFVANHITNQSYYTSAVTDTLRLQMLNGKYNNMLGKKLENAIITEADKAAKNGVLQVIDKMVPALPNAWEMLETNTTLPAKQKAFLLSGFVNVFDPTNAIQIGVDPLTGNPIYQPGTDSIRRNRYWNTVYDLRDESKQFTFFILADNAWDSEVNKFKPFYITGTTDSTALLSGNAVVNDFAVEGLYEPASIPDTLLSKFNTKLGIDKSAITQTIKTSNGIIYVMSKLEVTPKNKFKQYFIEAENYRTTSANRRNNTYFRDRFNPVTGKDFRDVLVFNHGLPLFNINYRLNGVPALKFRAYWVAVHDNINGATASFTQKLGIEIPTSTVLPYITVPLNNFNEVYLGEFTLNSYKPFLDLYLTAANSTTANLNMIVCDYIRLEPVL